MAVEVIAVAQPQVDGQVLDGSVDLLQLAAIQETVYLLQVVHVIAVIHQRLHPHHGASHHIVALKQCVGRFIPAKDV
jgi:hypothetical protein